MEVCTASSEAWLLDDQTYEIPLLQVMIAVPSLKQVQWWFSVYDIVGVLNEEDDHNKAAN
jgi:hypothetical protein